VSAGAARRARAVMLALTLAAVAARPVAAQPAEPASAPRDAVAQRYATTARVGYVRRAIAALVELGAARDDLEQRLYQAVRASCGATSATPALMCALEAGRRSCLDQPASCRIAADVMLVNLRGSSDLLDEATRLRLVRGGGDYHRAVLAELQRRYAALAAELVLAEPDAARELPVSAAAVDRFCARRDLSPSPPRCAAPSPTCVPSLSWQRCVAAVIWFATAAEAP
jgi:hypothetical protein